MKDEDFTRERCGDDGDNDVIKIMMWSLAARKRTNGALVKPMLYERSINDQKLLLIDV